MSNLATPTRAGQMVRRLHDDRLGITVSEPRRRTGQIGVQWIGGDYPVLMHPEEIVIES